MYELADSVPLQRRAGLSLDLQDSKAVFHDEIGIGPTWSAMFDGNSSKVWSVGSCCAAGSELAWQLFCAAHTHLQDAKLTACVDEVIRGSVREGVSKIAVNATHEDDWADVLALADRFPETICPCIGIHPWWSHTQREGWQERMTQLLVAHPRVQVGEIGLDKLKARHCDRDAAVVWEEQQALFEAQLVIASACGRVVSVHSVGSYPEVLKGLRGHPDVPALLHSFAGPSKQLNGFIKHGCMFSIVGEYVVAADSARSSADVMRWLCSRDHMVFPVVRSVFPRHDLCPEGGRTRVEDTTVTASR